MTKPIFIIHGLDYQRGSGGIRALHKLLEMLSDRGERTIMPGCKLKDGTIPVINGEEEGKTILIEPEVAEGVCPDADLIVRWLLNSPGKAGPNRSKTWGKNELRAHFDERFSMEDSIPLAVPHVDDNIFHNRNNPSNHFRKINCFYANKARAYMAQILEFPKGVLDVSVQGGFVKRGDWEHLASIFRKTDTLYTMEETATSIEASLCGAKVKYLASDYMPNPPIILDHASWYRNLVKRSGMEVDDFIDACYKRLGLRRFNAVAA